jgi:hypothetical protein
MTDEERKQLAAERSSEVNKGNTNSSRNNRLWADTLKRALIQADGNKIRAIAEALIEKAASGDVSAIRELGDRVDGKPTQQIDQTTERSVRLHIHGRSSNTL